MKIGITGGIASGKSLVTEAIKNLGYHVVDADIVARDVVKQGTECYRQIVSEFGEDILEVTGEINRKKLGGIIFSDLKARERLNQITHPVIRSLVLAEAAKIEEGEGIVFLDIPLLFETGYEHAVDRTVLVYISHSIQVKRLIQRDAIDENYAKAKISSQMSLERKKELADYIIDNNGTTSSTIEQTQKVVEAILKGE
ncbi:dephospho-CoA kinase [Desulfuribacillus alkaliarsenatis]|uniref:Dephospho-CoA kinase n=1 Tax=Desulfuribacillus alkaliarsenatis TaxID=766136 RepID=A0A1E5FYF4_9FIRM|nr:dephospho-CoA kinase [Desulfuribacillus alkaliarsenatis]OEF95599.1 dephospho-CoA kinase [Desulfuribacillus alkaliarsenatis]